MDEEAKKYLKELHSKISSMSPDEQLQFLKEINEIMSEASGATHKFRDELKELRDEIKTEEISKKIQE